MYRRILIRFGVASLVMFESGNQGLGLRLRVWAVCGFIWFHSLKAWVCAAFRVWFL